VIVVMTGMSLARFSFLCPGSANGIEERWTGRIGSREGIFPANFVEVV
jgi:hypothetical protein